MVSVMLYPCICCVVLCFVNCLVKQCAICLGVVEYYGYVESSGGALLDRPCMVFQIMCVLCL